MKFKLIILSISLIAIIFLFGGVYALGENNLSIREKADLCVKDSHRILDELSAENFSVMRINDSIKELDTLYEAQNILVTKNRPADFSIMLSDCSEIEEIYSSALISRDKVATLIKFYNESLTSDMNTSSVDSIINEINNEMASERYEKVSPLVDKAYSEIINVKSSQTNIKLFYDSTTKGVRSFLIDNWIGISIFIVICLLFFLIYRTKISSWIINRKINSLELRRKTIKELIMKTQKDYFSEGKMPQEIYSIRTKKFAELIRDIDRQIPLLKEDLARIHRKSKK